MKINLKWLNLPVLVGALGYFVDIYDLVLFGVVRTNSLKDLNIPTDQLLDVGLYLINWQMAGLMVGGILWGILGDKRGRVSVLFGSILIYSLANLINAFVQDITTYAALRFFAGFGLAGELGAAITLVSESLPTKQRGYGTTFVATIGLFGGVAASVLSDQVSWRNLYLSGGLLGLALLVLRWQLKESNLYTKMQKSSVSKGDLKLLLSSPRRAFKFLCCILIGVPIYFVVGILITFAPELAVAQKALEPVSSGTSILYYYLGLAVGDGLSGLLSQWWKSRIRVLALYLFTSTFAVCIALKASGYTAAQFYECAFLLGIATGYWAMCVTVAAEQFGTNLRSTVAISVPNLVRGSLILITLGFQALKGHWGIVDSLWCVGGICLLLAIISLTQLPETFGLEMDYLEKD